MTHVPFLMRSNYFGMQDEGLAHISTTGKGFTIVMKVAILPNDPKHTLRVINHEITGGDLVIHVSNVKHRYVG
jgi:hypothetical protein